MREKRADPELGFSANHVHMRGFPELCKPIGFLINFRAQVRAWLKPAAGRRTRVSIPRQVSSSKSRSFFTGQGFVRIIKLKIRGMNILSFLKPATQCLLFELPRGLQHLTRQCHCSAR